MDEAVDGDFKIHGRNRQLYPPAFLWKMPELLGSWTYSDEQLAKLVRGGHDPKKVYAAYKAAVEQKAAQRSSWPNSQGLRVRPKRAKAGIFRISRRNEREGIARVPHAL